MRILWINNIAIPKIAQAVGMKSVPVGGWMVKLADELVKKEDIELAIAFPYAKDVDGTIDGLKYYSFCLNASKVKIGNLGGQDKRFREMIEKFAPDVVHIFGTEYSHSYVVTQVCKEFGIQDRVVVSIQGIVSVIARHCCAHLDLKTIYARSLRDFYKGNVSRSKKNFENAGKFEIETIKNVKHVIGRTDWDRACTKIINPRVKYHFNNEMLRDSFYTAPQWDINKCEKYSIFFSQATMPLKGMHLFLEAVSILKKEFPGVKVYIAGKSYYEKKAWKLSYYEKHILKYIRENELRDTVNFLGFLDEKSMCQQYLKSHVFVSASSIENSPNSVCEAMILGVPTVSSMVGGVANLLEHGTEGFYYQADAPYMLAHYVERIFNDETLSKQFSDCSRRKAQQRHEVSEIIEDLSGIYTEIYSEKE